VNDLNSTSESNLTRRRKVLRGALSAPVVLTLSSGASATMSSNRRCLANQVTNPQHGIRAYATGASTIPSTVIRVKLYVIAGTTPKYYVRGSEVTALAHPSRPVTWISGTGWREFNPGTNMLVEPIVAPPSIPAETSPLQYVVVQMDQHGYIRSVGKNTTSDMSLVHGTCWNSFRAGPV
jgi:hypothetical protein